MQELEKIFQVSEFNEFVDIYLHKVGDVVVEGELSEIKVNQGKWVYATLKDEKASVGLFGTVFQISNARQLEPGMKVHVFGYPGLYQKLGRFNLQTHQIIPVGEGALQAMFDKLKVQLEEEGLFAEERKRKITEFPENIGLITAKGSQAYNDFVKIIQQRMGGITINFYPVNVQGKDSVPSIVKAFRYFNKSNLDLDAIVLVRGGGSLEDLISFNDETVARAIFSSKHPVVCGVGHEGDISLADLVADVRASTPSNAAEILTRERTECIREVKHMISRIETNINQLIKDHESRVTHAVNVIEHEIKDMINEIIFVTNKFKNSLIQHQHKLKQKQQWLNVGIKQIAIHTDHVVKSEKERLGFLTRTLKNMDHRKLLKRGFSIKKDDNGRIVKKTTDVKSKSNIETVLSDGTILSVVSKTS